LAETGFEIEKNRLWGWQKLGFWGRRKPVLRSAKTGFEICKSRSKDRKKTVMGVAKTGSGVSKNQF